MHLCALIRMNVFLQLLQLIRLDSIGLTWRIRLPSAKTLSDASNVKLSAKLESEIPAIWPLLVKIKDNENGM